MRLRNIPRAKAVLAASPYVIQEPEQLKGLWRERFGNNRPLYVEIGMGKGKFLTTLARQNPAIDYVGIERYSSVLLRAVEALQNKDTAAGEAQPDDAPADDVPADDLPGGGCGSKETPLPERPANRGLGNIYFLCADAAALPDYFAPGEVDRIYLNFSDPWPKARHADRRLTSRRFLSRYEKVLKEGGQVEFKTDNRELFDFSLEEFRAAKGWELAAYTYDLHNEPGMREGNVMTEYEEKFSRKGNPIHKLIARRTGSGLPADPGADQQYIISTYIPGGVL